MGAWLAAVVRVFAFVGKELIETIRRPGAILSLVLGPFLIMAVFGLGFSGVRRPLDTVIVASPSSTLPTDVEAYQDLAGPALHIVELTADRDAAEASVRGGSVDMAIVIPDDPEAIFRAGTQSVLEVLIDEVDPVDENYAAILSGMLADEINQRVVEGAVREGQGIAIGAGNPEAALIPADVVASPTRAEVHNLAPSPPLVLSFFGPAVLALILQHLAVTLVAMSLVRERKSGVMELFRISPVSAAEVLAGKVIAFGVLGAIVAFATLGLLVAGFSIPILGPPALIAATIGLLLLASIGVGLVIAVISDSERQAVQLSLLVLLAAVFFSGFVLGIDVHGAGACAGIPPARHARHHVAPGPVAARLDERGVGDRCARRNRARNAHHCVVVDETRHDHSLSSPGSAATDRFLPRGCNTGQHAFRPSSLFLRAIVIVCTPERR